jgi:hypothetical protein
MRSEGRSRGKKKREWSENRRMTRKKEMRGRIGDKRQNRRKKDTSKAVKRR